MSALPSDCPLEDGTLACTALIWNIEGAYLHQLVWRSNREDCPSSIHSIWLALDHTHNTAWNYNIQCRENLLQYQQHNFAIVTEHEAAFLSDQVEGSP